MTLLALSRYSITQEWLGRRTKPTISVGQHVVGKETHTGGVIPFQRERWIRVNWHPTIQTRRADVCPALPSLSPSPAGSRESIHPGVETSVRIEPSRRGATHKNISKLFITRIMVRNFCVHYAVSKRTAPLNAVPVK